MAAVRLSHSDRGSHVVCAVMTSQFLDFSREQGNDLITPCPEFQFPGLKPGDRWCLCALRWVEAVRAGVIAPVILDSTHEKILDHVSLETLASSIQSASLGLLVLCCEEVEQADFCWITFHVGNANRIPLPWDRGAFNRQAFQ